MFAKTKPEPESRWATRLRSVFKALFDPDTTSSRHPVPDITSATSVTHSVGSQPIDNLAGLWKTHQTRKAVYDDINRMDSEDETVATALDIIADCSINWSDSAGTIVGIMSEDKRVKTILGALTRRVDLVDEIWQISRNMVKHGNEFREVLIDRQEMHIVGFKQTISYQIYPATNDHGDKVPGWLYFKDGNIYTETKGQKLAEWQIVPFLFGTKHGYLAVPPLATARRNWLRLSKIEDGMAVARLVRAYDKIVHRIPVKPEHSKDEIAARIRNYRDAIQKRRMLDSDGMVTQTDTPLDVDTDFFLPDDGSGRGGVTLLSANNAQLSSLNDVIYAREKLLTRLQVPIGYLQLSTAQKTHISSASKQKGDVDLQFARMLRRVQRALMKGLRRLCDMELMLHGITPSEDLYTIVLTSINTKDLKEDADIELTYAQAAVYFVEAFGMLPPDLLASKFMHLDPDQKKLMESFLAGDGKKVMGLKMKAMEMASKPQPAPGIKDRLPGDSNKGVGSGNQNKSRARRTTEQVGKTEPKAAKQTIEIEELVDLFYTIQEGLHSDLLEQGVAVPDIDEIDQKNRIRAGLEAIALQ